MNNYKTTWLPHLKNSIPEVVTGSRTCMYLMSLEGWRRGLQLKFQIKKHRNILSAVSYSLNDGVNEHIFHGSRGDFVSKEAIKICMNKDLTNKYLSEANVSVPVGKGFTESVSDNEILNYANKIGYPVVLKPATGEGGAGVVTNIKNDKELQNNLNRFRKLNPAGKVIVEKFFVGEDFRVYVLDGKVIGAFHRRAQSVVGDGTSTLRELLIKKNKERHLSPFLAKGTIKIDKKMKGFLAERGLSEDSVPKVNERVFLRRNGEFFGQRDAVNVTDKLSSKMKELAISAVKAIPGLPHGGVDMLIDLENDEGIVNEVNSRAQISNHVFPVKGEAVDIPKMIIDYYFPETKGNYVSNIPYYYDYKPVLDAFETSTLNELKIPTIPKNEQVAKKYIVTGSNLENKYLKRLQRQARDKKLNGHAKILENGKISVVVAGLKKRVDDFKNIIEKHPYKKVTVNSLESEEYNKPVSIGFIDRKQ